MKNREFFSNLAETEIIFVSLHRFCYTARVLLSNEVSVLIPSKIEKSAHTSTTDGVTNRFKDPKECL